MARRERGGSGGGKARKSDAPAAHGRAVAGILLGGAAVLSLLALATFQPRIPKANWAGPVGHGFANVVLEVAGLGAYAAGALILLAAVALVAGWPRLGASRWASWLVFGVAAMALVDLGARSRLQGHP